MAAPASAFKDSLVKVVFRGGDRDIAFRFPNYEVAVASVLWRHGGDDGVIVAS